MEVRYCKYDSRCAQNSAHILEEFIGHLFFSEYNVNRKVI